MSRTERSGDLRARMQRVAAKPQQKQRRNSAVASVSASKTRAARTPRARSVDAVAEDVAVRELPQRHPGEGAIGRPRTETAFAWAMWELTTVPARRWKWFKQFARGRGDDATSTETSGEEQEGG